MIQLIISLCAIVLAAVLYGDVCMYLAEEQDINNENF